MHSTYPHFKPLSTIIEKRIDDLINRMTLPEKIEYIGGLEPGNGTKGIERLGIPPFRMGDGPNGVHWWCTMATAYPTSICVAASWDVALAKRFGEALGRDCRARGVHILLAPGVNIHRSPLCGRNFEYLGEDPCLTSQIAVAHIIGVQSNGVAATVKHFAINFQEFERHHVSSDVDERTLHEIYLPAFRAAVQDGGCAAVMSAYNLVNGIHCSEHRELLTGILKEKWGFDGIVMSDWDSCYSAEGCANAGLDLEMPVAKWMNTEKLLPFIEKGKVREAVIDDKVRRILRMGFCFGWFDYPQQDTTIPMRDPSTEAVALDIARGGIVLLKNENAMLPLDFTKQRRIAVIGTQALHPEICGGGSAWSPPTRTVSIIDSLRELVGTRAEIVYAPGVDVFRGRDVCRRALLYYGGKQGVWAQYFKNLEFSGTAGNELLEPGISLNKGFRPTPEWPRQGYSVRWTAQIKPEKSGSHVFYLIGIRELISIWIDGVKIEPETAAPDSDWWRYVEMDLIAGKTYDLRVECKKTERKHECKFGFEHVDEITDVRNRALQIARESDAVVACVGFNQFSETEGSDRQFQLPGRMGTFLQDLGTASRSMAVVITSGGGVDMLPWIEKTNAIVQIWYPGQEGGKAVAEVLTGAVNPSGKLPVTFVRRLEDCSSFDCYHDTDKDGRVVLTDGIFCGYRHHDKTGIAPLFPFGFGLSYTTFSYANIRLSSPTIQQGEQLFVMADITNTGTREGAEVVQLYISDTQSQLARPVKELKGFSKLILKAGERKTVVIEIDESALRYYDPDKHAWVYEPGEFEAMLGASSADIRLQAKFMAK